MVWLARGSLARGFLTNWSWIFLILGIAWWTEAFKKRLTIFGLFIGPWITGAVTCTYLVGLIDRRSVTFILLVLWPLVSAFFAALPTFLKSGPRLKVPSPAERQYLVTLILSSAIVSCWIYFHLTTRIWFVKYPSLLADNFTNSAFVVRVGSSSSETVGDEVLDLTQPLVSQAVEQLPSWSEVEKWLIFDAERFQKDAAQDMIESTIDNYRYLQEFNRCFWSFDFNVLPVDPNDPTRDEYQLELIALWQGPLSAALAEPSDGDEAIFRKELAEENEQFVYKLTKTCFVKPRASDVAENEDNPSEWRSEITCQADNDRQLSRMTEVMGTDNTAEGANNRSEIVLPASEIEIPERGQRQSETISPASEIETPGGDEN